MSPTSTPQALLRVDTLGCERGGRLLFDNLSLQLNRGEGLRIEGGNGSGKTSLLRLLAGLSQPQRGRVQWPACSPPQLLYIGHLAAVKALLSPLENLQWWAALHAPAAASDRSALLAALTAAGIGAALEQPCHSLSAGQQRRVALARLHIAQQPLWLLDEPFTAIDSHGVEELKMLISQHLQRGGSAVITSHQSVDIAGFHRCSLADYIAQSEQHHE